MTGENEVRVGLLQALYFNRGRAPGFASSRLAEALGFEEDKVRQALEGLVTECLVDEVAEGFRISKKGFDSLYQRELSYCPHL